MSLSKDKITALYIAVYGRAPDTEGMNYWLQTDTYENAAAGFLSHAVFKQTYENDTNREMVSKFYTNIFGSAGDIEGIDYWTAALDNGASVNQVLASFLDVSLNGDLSHHPEGLARQNTLKNKVAVANYYQEQLGDDFSLDGIDSNSIDIIHAPDFKKSVEVMRDITANPESVTEAIKNIDKMIAEDNGFGESPVDPKPEPTPDPTPENPAPEPKPDPKPDPTTVIIKPQEWSTGSNTISFTLQFDSKIELDQIQMLGGGSISLSLQSVTQKGVTTVTASMHLMNGKPEGSIGVDLSIPASFKGNTTLTIKDFTINHTKYPEASNADGSNVIKFNYADLIAPFTLINESVNVDSSGYDYLIYSHINDVLSLPGAKAGLIEAGKVTDAYLHIEEGERFIFDHDTFVLRSDSSANYRLKFTPEDSSLFSSNVISTVYKADGTWGGSIMNAIGNKSTYVDGALYSSPFSLEAGEDKFLNLSMRWSDINDAMAVAKGPATYQVELLEVVGVMRAMGADETTDFFILS